MFEEFFVCEYWVLVVAMLFFMSLFLNIKLKKELNQRAIGDAALIRGAYFDEFTNLPNKKNIEIVISEQIDRSKRHKKPFLIAVIEVLNYKEEKIELFSHHLVASLRDEDIVAHIEKNYFLILFNEYFEEENFSVLLHRLHRNLQEKKEFHIALGRAQYPQDALDVQGLIEVAMKEMKK